MYYAFLLILFCRYAYTDSCGSITVANVMDVLAASQKYQMAKLTRYCYEFIQKSLNAETACFFWKKVYHSVLS